jgi:hypothetical protein
MSELSSNPILVAGHTFLDVISRFESDVAIRDVLGVPDWNTVRERIDRDRSKYSIDPRFQPA